MGKSVYSLVLSDEIIAAVDAAAARGGYSRSGLVNHILAEYTSLVAPETRARQAVGALERQALEQGFRGFVSQGGTLTLRTALRYKYNPSLSYTVELKEGEESMGRLHVALRSQNESLLTCFGLFFDLWSRLEARHLPGGATGLWQQASMKRFSRALRRPRLPMSGEEAGEAIADYIGMLDACLKTYFGHLDDAEMALRETERQYLRWLGAGHVLSEL